MLPGAMTGTDVSDVVLSDGSTAVIRPLEPSDAEDVHRFHARLSPDTVRLRYFGAHPRLSEGEVERLVHNDAEHLGIVAERDSTMIGVAQYDRPPGSEEAEVAFVVDDTHQGLGIGTLMLEHLASHGRRNGVKRFVADTLFDNRRMLGVFYDAGFIARSTIEDGLVHLVMDIAPTSEALAALYERDRRAVVRSIGRLLRPGSVAVLGASRRPGTIGHELVRNLVNGGFQGPVYPVNPNADHVASLPCWPGIGAIPGPVDLAVVAVPAADVLGVVEECGRKGVRGLVVVSSGFAEIGARGADTEQQIARTAHAHGMRLVGPNCFGLLNTDPAVALNATFARDTPTRGRLGFASQSGGLGIAILAEARRRTIGLSSFVSMGNKADVSGNDLLVWWDQDDATGVVLLYLESFGNPRKFGRLARHVGRSKPIVTVKSGRSMAGRKAASSHTAALAGSDEAVAALCRQAGVVRVDTIEELFDVAEVLDGQPLAAGRRVGVLTNAGGPGVLAADACVANGLEVPELSAEVQSRLRSIAPVAGATANPVDMGAGASPPAYRASMEVLLDCGEVDAVVVICTPPLVTDVDAVAAAIAAAVDEAYEEGRRRPVVASLLGTEHGRAALHASRRPVPSFTYPETAVRALTHAVGYAEWRHRPEGVVPPLDRVDPNEARRRLPDSAETGGWVTGAAAMAVLDAYGIPTLRTVEVHDGTGAARAAADLGGRVAVKVLGDRIVHKSDQGGVRLGLTPEQAATVFGEMEASFGADMSGAVVQPMAATEEGVEVLVGAVQDPLFGPHVVFGLGGTTVEILNDHTSGLAPLTDLDAEAMVDGLRGARLLGEFRGRAAVDRAALTDVLHRVGRLVEDLPEIAELDCNPVLTTPQGAVVVDARLRVGPGAVRAIDDSRDLR